MYYRRNYFDMILLLMSVTVLTTNLPNCEGNPYPFLNLVSRVSRGPSIRSTEDELDGSSQLPSLTSAGRAAFLKSPAFHMRFRPNRYAHVHAPPQSYNFPPASMSSSSSMRGSGSGPGSAGSDSDSSPLFTMNGGLPGINPSDSEEILLNDDNKNDSTNHHDSSISSSSAAFVGGFVHPGGKSGNSGTAADESDSAHELNSEEPTFTPFISARALSNMGKFFEHLRENLVAIRQDDADNSEIGPPERRRIVHSGTSGSDDSSQSQKATYTDDDTADEGANHDYNFSSDGKGASSALSMALRWKPPATGEFRGAIPSPLSSDGGANRLQKIQTFIQPLTDEESYRRRANNYNPSWLWTNMGLGRKRRR